MLDRDKDNNDDEAIQIKIISSDIYSSGNKFVVFCGVAATLQNTTNLFPLLYNLRGMAWSNVG